MEVYLQGIRLLQSNAPSSEEELTILLNKNTPQFLKSEKDKVKEQIKQEKKEDEKIVKKTPTTSTIKEIKVEKNEKLKEKFKELAKNSSKTESEEESKLEGGEKTFFSSQTKNNVVYKPGDCAFFTSNQTKKDSLLLQKSIGRIESIFEENRKRYVVLQRYYRPEEISNIQPAHPIEIFFSNDRETIPFANVISKCKVTKKNEYDKNDANKFQKEKDHFFSFRKYNSLTHSVESYEDEEEKIVSRSKSKPIKLDEDSSESDDDPKSRMIQAAKNYLANPPSNLSNSKKLKKSKEGPEPKGKIDSIISSKTEKRRRLE